MDIFLIHCMHDSCYLLGPKKGHLHKTGSSRSLGNTSGSGESSSSSFTGKMTNRGVQKIVSKLLEWAGVLSPCLIVKSFLP